MSVTKSGRTTGLTTSTITGLSAEVSVGYDQRTAHFKDAVVVDSTGGGAGTYKFGAGGDSGSTVIATDLSGIIGSLFAGSPTLIIVDKITTAMAMLKFSLQPGAVAKAVAGGAIMVYTG